MSVIILVMLAIVLRFSGKNIMLIKKIGEDSRLNEITNALPENEKLNLNDEDFLSNQMLYRNVHSYAVGHGCAAEWKTDGDTVTEISTAIFPVYEMKPIVPNSFDGI